MLEFDWFRFFISPVLKKVQLTGAEQFFWLQKLKFQCACPELFPLANFGLCAEKSGCGIWPLKNLYLFLRYVNCDSYAARSGVDFHVPMVKLFQYWNMISEFCVINKL